MPAVLEVIGPRTGSGPLTYTLAELGTVDLQTVFAHFDGTAASGGFRPTVTIRSQSGALLARLFPDTELAAGDSADVTYLPFRRGATAAPAGDTFAQLVASLATTRDLRGYWRLGDGASPYADTSGNAGGPINMLLTATGTPMTPHYTPGALPVSQDDGAVAFHGISPLNLSDYLTATDARFGFGTLPGWTLSLFVKPFSSTGQPALILGTQQPFNGGYGIYVAGATPQIRYRRSDPGGTAELLSPTINLNEWLFVVAVYGPTNGEARLYLNGVLVASQTVVQVLTSLAALHIGANGSLGVDKGSADAAVDEVAVWGDALSGTEVAALATAAGY